MTREDVIQEALRWVDDPNGPKTFRHQGRRIHEAVDCAGLIIGVAKAVGAIPAGWDYTAYPQEQNAPQAALWLAHWADPIEAADIEPADVMLFTVARGELAHMAWAVPYPFGGLGMVHAYGTVGRVAMSNVDERWNGRLAAGYRLRGLNG